MPTIKNKKSQGQQILDKSSLLTGKNKKIRSVLRKAIVNGNKRKKPINKIRVFGARPYTGNNFDLLFITKSIDDIESEVVSKYLHDLKYSGIEVAQMNCTMFYDALKFHYDSGGVFEIPIKSKYRLTKNIPLKFKNNLHHKIGNWQFIPDSERTSIKKVEYLKPRDAVNWVIEQMDIPDNKHVDQIEMCRRFFKQGYIKGKLTYTAESLSDNVSQRLTKSSTIPKR
jgi:hypothetical protein